MLRRASTLLHVLVILTAGMIAGGSVATFAAFTYRSAAEQELRSAAETAIRGAVETARYDVWNQTLVAGQTANYTINGQNVSIQMVDINHLRPSTWLARGSATVAGRVYSLNIPIGLPKFPESEDLNWVYNPNNGHWYALVTVREGMTWATGAANAKTLTAPDGKTAYLATATSQPEWDWIV
ncbi:MAG: hypothetical protein MH204_12050, partial [Fimbriimonadaceae bacterium]|nr:hypothetical protein [Fimbriimonadaceae bacterium]